MGQPVGIDTGKAVCFWTRDNELSPQSCVLRTQLLYAARTVLTAGLHLRTPP